MSGVTGTPQSGVRAAPGKLPRPQPGPQPRTPLKTNGCRDWKLRDRRRLRGGGRCWTPAELTGWFEAHAAPLALYARQWLDRGAAEDVVQEAFVRLMLQARPPGSVKAWLYRAVRNEAISLWRSTQRRHERERRTAVPEIYFERHHGDPIDAEMATAALRQLPESQREVMVLRIWAAMTLKEISLLIGSPVSTVFHHYQEGLRVLREKMGVSCQTNHD